MRRLLVLAAVLVALPAGAVNIEYVAIRDSGNAPDTATNCLNDAPDCGSVPYDYAIAKYEVTNAQYAEFLSAVAVPDDPFGLYNANMSILPFTELGTGVLFYYVPAGFESKPVAYVSFWDAVRFANWLHNGQGTGDTETGAYTITFDGIANNTVTRNPGATTFLPSENEWYKAAFYDPMLNGGTGGYFDYPAGSDAETTCTVLAFTDPNTANCGGGLSTGPADVGSYLASPSPNGTFDQGGNLYEWNEAATGQSRGVRGGSWLYDSSFLAAASRDVIFPSGADGNVGFRVARTVPEPAQVLLVLTGGLVLATARRQRRA